MSQQHRKFPNFDGNMPDRMEFVLGGKITEDEDMPEGCPQLGDQLLLEVYAEVTNVTHAPDKDGELVRLVKAKAEYARSIHRPVTEESLLEPEELAE